MVTTMLRIAYILFMLPACALSWFLNKSIIWALVHAMLSIWYVLYAAIFRTYDVEVLLRSFGG